MSKATIVSMMPIPMNFENPTVHPSVFSIPAVPKRGDFNIQIVPDAFTYVFMDDNRGHNKHAISAIDVATSLVMDYRRASTGVSEEAFPGILALDGELSKDKLKKDFEDILEDLEKAQDLWLMNMVKDSDDLWSKYRQHRVIPGLARTAVKFLGLERPWVEIIQEVAIKCPACLKDVPAGAAICFSCNCILDPKKYSSLKFAGAEA